MIFVTVGSTAPFDRLVSAVDKWAGMRTRGDVFAQIGRSTFTPQHIKAVQSLDPAEFRETIRTAQLIVAHAGMGSIISALEMGKPIIIMPRREHLGETRNEHQVATAEQFGRLQGVIVADDERELFEKLDESIDSPVAPAHKTDVSVELVSAIRDFIAGDESGQCEKQAVGRNLRQMETARK